MQGTKENMTNSLSKERLKSESHPDTYSQGSCEHLRHNSSGDDVGDAKYRVINKDTGEIMDIRSIEQSMPTSIYNHKFSVSSNDYVDSRDPSTDKHNPQESSPDGDADSDIETISTEQHLRGKPSTSATNSSSSRGTGIFSFFRTGSKSNQNKYNNSSNPSTQNPSNMQENYKEDPIPFVKVTTIKKDISEFDDLIQLQTLNIHNGPIWTVKFSPDGMFMGSAGQDTRVIVWKIGHVKESNASFSDTHKSVVAEAAEAIISNCTENNNRQSTYSSNNTNSQPSEIPTPIPSHSNQTSTVNQHGQHRRHHPHQLSNSSMGGIEGNQSEPSSPPTQSPTTPTANEITLKFEFLDPEPYRVYIGHTGDVIDIAWSKSIFLLSASIDKTVRLWHVSRYASMTF